MADNVIITPGSGNTVAADEVTDGTLGTVKVQYVKLMDGTLDGTTKAVVNANGLKIDGSAVTQPVSAASLPLPTGASTSAKQPALGTAGTPSVDVLSVQGVASMTALKVDGSAVTQPVSQGTAAVDTAGWPVKGGTVTPVTAAWTSATAPNTAATIAVTDYGTVVYGSVNSGTISGGAVSFEVSSDGGSNWFSVDLAEASAKIVRNSYALSNGSTILRLATGGFTHFRVRLSVAITGSGTVNVTLTANALPYAPSVVVTNQAASNCQVQIGDSTNLAAVTAAGALKVDASTTLNTVPWLVEARSATIATYSGIALNIVPAATPTDIFTLTGSATKTVKVLRCVVTGTQTTAGTVSVVLLKRSTANTAGTSTAPTITSHDSNNAAATATFLAYTANPTTGTLVGNTQSKKVFIPAPATAADSQGWDWIFVDQMQPIVLRGTSQVFAVNLNSITLTGGSLTCTMIWSEE